MTIKVEGQSAGEPEGQEETQPFSYIIMIIFIIIFGALMMFAGKDLGYKEATENDSKYIIIKDERITTLADYICTQNPGKYIEKLDMICQ